MVWCGVVVWWCVVWYECGCHVHRYLNDNPLLTSVQIGAFPNSDNFMFKCDAILFLSALTPAAATLAPPRCALVYFIYFFFYY